MASPAAVRCCWPRCCRCRPHRAHLGRHPGQCCGSLGCLACLGRPNLARWLPRKLRVPAAGSRPGRNRDARLRRWSPMTAWAPGPGLAAYRAGVTIICEIAALFTAAQWAAITPCGDWRAADIAGHLRCLADDYHEYLDDAPHSRLARLMATGFPAATPGRTPARPN